MRKLFSMMLALLALVGVSCEPSQQGGNDNTGFSFGEPNVTSSSIQVKITPADARGVGDQGSRVRRDP